MDFNALDLIKDKLVQDLKNKEGFNEPVELDDDLGSAFMVRFGDEVAYSVLYNNKKSQFILRSASVDSDNNPGEWSNISTWLFDKENGTRADAESIANDFTDVIKGPKNVKLVSQKKKKSKEDPSVDPLFFINRLAGIFPELKDDIKKERITYGQIRFATFAKEKVAPLCEDLAVTYKGSSTFTKLCNLFSDMYANGDMDVRAVLTISILNNVNETAINNVLENVSDELKLNLKHTRKLIGKTIKPEKKKKSKKIVDRL